MSLPEAASIACRPDENTNPLINTSLQRGAETTAGVINGFNRFLVRACLHSEVSKTSLFQSISKAFKDKYPGIRSPAIKASQTQSNQIQPYPSPYDSLSRVNPTICDQIRLTFYRVRSLRGAVQKNLHL
jgi:hypothetical protein